MKNNGNILWGVILIIIGIILGLNSLNITDINIFFDGWWTLFIIIPSIRDLFKDEDKTGSIIGLIIGILLLLCSQGYIKFETIWKLILPTILVILGISLIFKNTIYQKKITKINNNKTLEEYCATFGGQNIEYEKDEEFKGCNLTSIFGSIKCDLSKSKIEEDTIINTFAIFGGIDIIVPENIKVKINSTPIFGGVTNKRKKSENKDAKTIYINATNIFGGTDIK